MREFPVYKAEREAGLEEKIRAQASIAYACVVEPCPELSGENLTRAARLLQAQAAEAGHVNLYPFKSLLVTAGVWNKNDDVFDRAEVWAARRTAEDQPINDGHDCSKIIGHMTDVYPANASDQMERLADDLTIDELPDKYHLVDTGVIYKHFDKEDLQKRVATIIKAVAEQKKAVSMECLFYGFDYGIIDPNGKQHVVTRNEESAFLTKHLRAYGGDGLYEKHKVGRLFRNMSFSGKGMVDKPANPASVVLATAEQILFSARNSVEHIKKISRDSTNTVYFQMSEQIAQAKSQESIQVMNEVELLKRQLEEANAATKRETEEKTKAQAALKEIETQKVAGVAAENKSLSEKLKATEEAKAAAEKAAAEAAKERDEVKAELAKSEAKQKLQDRVTTLVDIGLSKEEANAKAERLQKLDDEAFKAEADYESKKIAEFKKAGTGKGDEATIVSEKKPGEGHKKTDKLVTSPHDHKPKAADKTVEVVGTPRKSANTKGASTIGPMVTAEEQAAEATEQALETAQPEAEVALAAASEHVDETVKKLQTDVASFLTARREKETNKRRR